MTDTHRIRLTVNGRAVEAEVEARTLLSDFLREKAGALGVNVGCEHGVCGTCTVILDGAQARSCLAFAVQADGAEVLTVEGLARGGILHPLQEAFHDHHALQCGFCTPGMLLAAHDLLQRHPRPSPTEVRLGLAGNLCRCTGYQQIIEAVLDAAERLAAVPRGHR